MKAQLRGIGHVFSFTLVQQMKTKAYRISTIILAVLFILVPAGIMGFMEFLDGRENAEREPDYMIEEEGTVLSQMVETVYVVDQTGEEAVSFNGLNDIVDSMEVVYEDCKGDLESAAQKANADSTSLILVMDKADSIYQLSVLLPEHSKLSMEDAFLFENFLNNNFFVILTEKAGMDAVQIVGAMQGTENEVVTMDTEESENDDEFFDMILSTILSFFFIMLLYFLVLFYGQSVANSVIVEKTSKLMDTFLVSVKPGAMIFGKVFAIVTASALQFIIWIVSLIGGFAAGTMLVKCINPESDMLLLILIDSLSFFSGMFSVPGIILAILMVLAGFLLYCSLAAIGGSLAGKPEDLSSTNMLFTMILVFSFLGAMYGGGIKGLDMGFEAGAWLNWIPFTAILVTPAKIILGEMSFLAGLGSLSIVLLTSVLVLAAAGRVYHIMALFKGNPPSLVKMVKMLKDK